jgi:RNA polymerase sigma-70 factor (ECF subfamily)
MNDQANDRSDTFESHRPHLMSVAYRMLGSVSDAQDMLQEAYLRWRSTEVEVRSPKAFLTAIVTRLCLDHMKSAAVRRTEYVGSWLPEPATAEWERGSRGADSLSFAFLVMLEALAPIERAVFLLRDVFDYDYSEIAGVVEKSEENCRQIFHRAKESLETKRKRFDATADQRNALLRHFLFACATGDLRGLEAALRHDAVLVADGGGKVPSAIHPIVGRAHVARFFLGVRDKQPPKAEQLLVRVNGEDALVTYDHGRPVAILTIASDAREIEALYNVRNPDKLKFIAPPRLRDRIHTAFQYVRTLIQRLNRKRTPAEVIT